MLQLQGLHDVASVALLAVGPSRAALVVERLLCAHLKGLATPSLDVTMAVLRLLYPLLERHDAELHRFVTCAKVSVCGGFLPGSCVRLVVVTGL